MYHNEAKMYYHNEAMMYYQQVSFLLHVVSVIYEIQSCSLMTARFVCLRCLCDSPHSHFKTNSAHEPNMKAIDEAWI